MRIATLTLCALVAASHSLATPVFKITEVYTGLSGPDGTPDWIEVTNFGDMDGDTSVLWYDDESEDVASGAQLTSFMLSPGESAVFLVTGDVTATSVDEFRDIWGPVAKVGTGPGGGGLSQNGDQATILLGDGTVVDRFAFGGGAGAATFEDPTGTDSIVVSTLGLNGAYESAPFFNDNIIPVDPFLVTLVGSPGAIPEPGALALLVAGFATAGIRRRG
ncbi:MAG: PEP-CTERM sorting domain-containing protein [Planctomycetota bacterium]